MSYFEKNKVIKSKLNTLYAKLKRSKKNSDYSYTPDDEKNNISGDKD